MLTHTLSARRAERNRCYPCGRENVLEGWPCVCRPALTVGSESILGKIYSLVIQSVVLGATAAPGHWLEGQKLRP